MPRLKKIVRATRNKAIRVSKSRYVRNPRIWIPELVLIFAIIFWALPAFAAKAPGQLGYSIKRGEEAVISNLAPLSSWRDSLKLDFANNRVTEAAYVANQADQGGHSNQKKTAATINDLLGTYEDVYETRTTALNQKLKDNKKPSKADLLGYQAAAADTYDELQLLRLQAPPTSQLAVLTSIDDTQQNLAVLSDALGLRPLSNSDLSQLAQLVPVGVITQAQVDQLTAIESSRLLHTQLVNMINSGQLPSDITYLLDQDLIKQADPAHAKSFAAVSEFEQMQRISAVVAASRPTSAQQKEIKAFITAYKPGQTLPTDNTQQYTTPIVYGIALSGRLLTDLTSLKPLHMSSDNQAIMNNWKKVVDPPNLSDIYERLMTGAQTDPQLALRNMTRMQQELVDAQKAQVSYLVMPPGWSSTELPTLNQQMGIEIAQTTFAASKPDLNQRLADVLSIQNQLQTKLDSLQQSNSKTVTELQTKIDSFTGTPEQLATLKDQLAALIQTQTTTVTNLQTQIIAITDAHTQLDNKIDKLRQDQLTSLYELEIRATNTAQILTNSVKSDLTTKLNRVETNSQSLITSLETKVSNLGSDQAQLKTQLNGEITTIKSNYQALKADVQSQLDAGVATSADLQTSLSQAQSTLASQQTQLTSLGNSATALTTFVNQVKNDSETQINSLQNQIDVVKLDQQTTQTAVSDLQTITQTSAGLINGLQTRVDGLDSGQNTLRNQLTSSIATIRNDQDQFAAYVQAQIDAGAATSANLQTTLQTVQTALTQQASHQLSTLSTSAGALTTLVNQVKTSAETTATDLQSQMDALKIDQQTTKTSINALRDQQTAAINQVSGQVASLTVLQAEAGAAINILTQQATQAQSQINSLTNNFTTLQTTVGTIQQTQASLQTSVTNQQSELDSLTTQTQSAIDNLTTQQAQLATQVTGLASNVTTLSQTVGTIQTTSNATQAQLNTVLANPPWAIPAGTYVTQSEFDTLSTAINNQFAAKSAALDAQFAAYQTQLNASVSQLSSQVQTLTTTTTNTANTQTQQQTQINTLNSQVQALQTQVQQLLSATPHTGL